ncbi:peptidase S9B dipeptidylpeptidase IV domain protein [Gemmatirosa kalamazoonensis]|uniref:Peptidase S9B dipeptidylpeptidase IV domain protein n=1 Tax=Gemmatirosa kalamazoonensis TaxID=861299 RepID=W0RCR7_9BACT|nr:DPP IV N-terminal domain-containing protein [Gemmatirosa kalamazoonensis]AHG88909.1 peptidase S9B dipeptidylpeptidase IV domain protein [Gemmatirosa kalamazoonensis]
MSPRRFHASSVALLALVATGAGAQDRLPSMPGYDRYQQMLPSYQGAVRLGSVLGGFGFGRAAGGRGVVPPSGVTWSADGRFLDYAASGTRYRLDLASKTRSTLAGDAAATPAGPPPFLGRGGGEPMRGCGGAMLPPPERGRQRPVAASPDGKLLAHYRDRNVYVCDAAGANEVAVTTDGSEKTRTKYGTASWVYGEELGQTTAMWWSPSGDRLAYFRFDESQVPDFYITQNETKLQTTLDVEAYPKPGVPNPVVELYVYDVATKQSRKIDVRDGKPFTNDVVGHYVYDVRWAPNGKDLLIHRTNRRQNVLELAACSAATGACRAIIHEEWPTGWLENHPTMRFLADSNRFIWESERTGFKNYYLYDLDGRLLKTLTRNPFEAAGIVRVDERANALWYLARDGDNYLKTQLHRVRLDGTGDRRLTDAAFAHQVDVSPDGRFFVDVAQTHDRAPVSRLVDAASGKAVAELATSDVSQMEQRGIRKAELYSYLAADGKTTLYGEIWFPSNFDPSKQYPVLTAVYGGPESGSNVPTETFSAGNPLTEYGFIVVSLSSRAAPGLGRRALDAIYMKLGQTEIDDMAEGIKALYGRPYVDRNRVGIYGTSYGGYSAVMSILRHPDVFAVASSESPPTDWRNYDTIYTERYMWIPQENAEGYDKGAAMTYVKNLRGRLMLYFGTLDNNVHTNNTMQLVRALQAAGKSFELQAGPDLGHSSLNANRRMEFLVENLIQRPERIRQGYDRATP